MEHTNRPHGQNNGYLNVTASGKYNYLLFSLALQPSVGYGLLVLEVPLSHTMIRHSW
jgi:hypothetical protein